MDRRLPIYLLIDSSGSMRGEPIQSVNVGLSAMLSALRQDPMRLKPFIYRSSRLIMKSKSCFPCRPWKVLR